MMTSQAEGKKFEAAFQHYEKTRMYPPGYRKESPMTDVVKFAKELKELAAKAPPTILKMPSNTVGLPEGTFIPEALLKYIADCLLGKVD